MSNSKILGTYSPEDVNIVLTNSQFSHQVTGFADGSFVDISRDIQHAQLYTGADASHARVVRRVKNFSVTFNLHQASASNDFFSQLLNLDEQFRDETWLFSVLIKDSSGRSVLSAAQAFVTTFPDMSFSTEIVERPWILQCIGTDVHIGGNGRFDGEEIGTIESLGYTPDARWSPNA